jgi:hypothetical protein
MEGWALLIPSTKRCGAFFGPAVSPTGTAQADRREINIFGQDVKQPELVIRPGAMVPRAFPGAPRS